MTANVTAFKVVWVAFSSSTRAVKSNDELLDQRIVLVAFRTNTQYIFLFIDCRRTVLQRIASLLASSRS